MPKVELELHCRIPARPSIRESHWHKVERLALRFRAMGLNPMFSSIQLQHESDPLEKTFLRRSFELKDSARNGRHRNAHHTIFLFVADRGVEGLEVHWRHACYSCKIPWTSLGDRLSCLQDKDGEVNDQYNPVCLACWCCDFTPGWYLGNLYLGTGECFL